MKRSAGGILMAMAGISACAHAPAGPPDPLDLRPVTTQTAPPHARLYADCIGQAIDAGTYARASDPGTELLVFSCSGQPARAFYDGLATRSQAMGSEYAVEGRTLRTTEPLQRDRFGADGCSWDGVTDWRCDITLRTGTFLADMSPVQ
ncbi:hypothetical protein [Brevundimonas poindexterae]|uniref:hypothetical protein n=1 Tax=Brevundimonas poindexterae TaxID=74325 RepID=UPI001CFEAB5C|nr:hypothetical protein [Brevundimonas poindexterae]